MKDLLKAARNQSPADLYQLVVVQPSSLSYSDDLKVLTNKLLAILHSPKKDLDEELRHLPNYDRTFKSSQDRASFTRVCATIQTYLESIQRIQKACEVTFNSENQEHHAMIMTLWHSLRGDEQLKQFKSPQWIEIGF